MNKNSEHSISFYLQGLMTSDDRLLFEKELESNNILAKEFEEYKTIWELTNQLNHDSKDLDMSWDHFVKSVETPTKRNLDWLKVAASIALFAAVSIGIWYGVNQQLTHLSTGTHQLQDYSTVEVGNNSELIYSESTFNHSTREVTLEGQGCFDIAKSSTPFIVHTSTGDITVLGTKFNILETDNSGLTVVELLEGKITYTSSSSQVTLSPGQRLIHFGRKSPVVEQFDIASTWENDLSGKNLPLSYYLEQLKLNYQISISDINQKDLQQRYTFTLPKDNLKVCIQILSDVSGKSFAIIDNTIVLK